MNWTTEKLLEALVSLSKELGEPPTAVECNKCNYTANVTTYNRRFGSWNKAKEAANLETYNKFGSKTDLELTESLNNFYTREGRAPKQSECRMANNLFGPNTYKDRFGGWKEALKAAQVPENTLRTTQLSDTELLDSLKQFYLEEGRAPRHEDCNNKEYPYLSPHTVYLRRFKTWNNTLEAADIEIIYSGSSIAEDELAMFISSIYSGKILRNTRKVIGGKELDIYLPDLKLAIEFNGIYWHSAKFKPSNYHRDKTIECGKKGIRLIHVFEHELVFKEAIVRSRIKAAIGVLGTKIYARKCNIVELYDVKDFLNTNHIQGYAAASVKLGLEYKGEMVAVQTFSKSRFTNKYDWELVRYCNKLDTTVVGGASRLFKHFIKQKSPRSIVSYSDIRWNTGGLYEILGFSHSHDSAPNYWYFKGLKVESRMKYQKHKLNNLLEEFNPNWTEKENMEYNGFKRIYDCGNKVYTWEK